MTYMKISKILLILFLLLFSNGVKAKQKIVYVNMNVIMNDSLAGKSISQQLEKINQSNLKSFKKLETSLKLEETKILSQKNVLNEEEFKKKIISLQAKISDYNNSKKKTINELSKKKLNAQASLINSITPILADYSKENSISMIVSKQNIIIGKKELDITAEILKILNNKISNISLK